MSIHEIQKPSPIRAVAYARVSTKEQEQGYSIPAQHELLRSYGVQHDLVIDEEFIDVETAKAAGRPGFRAMVSYLQKHADCHVLLVEKTDRLYRNFKDYVTIDELDLEIHFVKENVVLRKDSRSSDKLVHGMKVVMAKNYLDNLSEEAKKGLCAKAAQGLWPSFAPLGYVNTLGPGGKRIIMPDPERAPIIGQLFEWFATGEYSVKALASKAYEAGFRFRKSQGKVSVSTLHKICATESIQGISTTGGEPTRAITSPWSRVKLGNVCKRFWIGGIRRSTVGLAMPLPIQA